MRARQINWGFLTWVALVNTTVAATTQSSVDPAGPQAQHISQLWWVMLYLLTGVFILVMSLLSIGAFRRRSKAAETSGRNVIQTDSLRETKMARVVMGGVVVTTVILFALLVSSFIVGRTIYSTPKEPTVLTIDITGHQWWWDVRYENQVASQIVTTANEIHIPVGRQVVFKLNSADVIHSFWVPNLHGKTDLIPGHPAETWLKADRTGVYRGQCAEFCGHQHAHMAFEVVVESEEQFQAWYESQLKSAPAQLTSSQSRGLQLFLSKPCVMCHTIQGTDAGGKVGPDLTHLASRQTIAAGALQNNRTNLSRWILNSQDVKPGNHMPPIPLNSEELNFVLDYLESLK